MSEQAEREPEGAELAAKAREGAHAMVVARVLSVLVTAASVSILPRLIPPADFGIWAMAGLALGVTAIVRELGLITSIVQAKILTLQQQDSYFRTSVAVSLGAAALLALAAPLLASFYDAPLLRSVVWACCASIGISGLGLVHSALLRRELQYGKVALIEGGGILCGLVASVTCAYLWRDVWALVAGYTASAVWMSATAWLLHRWLPGAPSRKRAKINLPFSFQVMSFDLLTYTGNNMGLLAGYRFGAADLGLFSRAQQLCFLTIFAFLVPLTETAFSLLCRLKSEAAYRDAYVSVARRVWVLFIPYAIVLPIVSDDLIVVLLGQRWAQAAPILAWLAPAVFGQALASLFEQLMLSQGRAKELRTWAVADLLLRGGGAVAGTPFGIVGLTAGFSLATFFLTVPLMVWIAGRSGPVRLRHQLAAMWPGLLAGAAAASGAFLAASGADTLGLGTGWAKLLLVGGSAVLAWALLCLVLRSARDALLGKGMSHE